MSKAFAVSRNAAPLSRISPKFLAILSTRLASCSDVLCFGLNPKCSSRSSPRLLTSFRILASRFFSNNLPIVSSRLMGQQDKSRAGSFRGFKMEITPACLHSDGKYWMVRIALKSVTRRDIAHHGRCFRSCSLYG